MQNVVGRPLLPWQRNLARRGDPVAYRLVLFTFLVTLYKLMTYKHNVYVMLFLALSSSTVFTKGILFTSK